MMTANFKTILKHLLALLLMLSSPHMVRAQQLQATLSHYSTENGLPSNTISSLRADDYGYVWLSTWNGISRFDGYNFYNYKTGLASGIRGMHNRVDNMVIDQAQNVWLKMYDGRIFVINRKTDRIEDPFKGITDHEEFRADYFFTPYVTSSGDVLISFHGVGLYKMHLNREGLKRDLIMTGKSTVYCIVEGYRNDIWVGTEKGVHRINIPNLSIERKGFFLDEHITCLTSNGYNIFAGSKSGKIMQFSYGQEPMLVKDLGREITSLYVDSHGTIWFSDLGDGAYNLNPKTGEVKFFNQHVLVPEFTSRGAEFGEALGKIWVRLNHGGYGYYNREADQLEYFHNDPSNPWNLSNAVNARLELNDGVIWESTSRRGLEKLEILKNTIPRVLLSQNPVSIMENEIRALHYDKKRGLLLIGNKKGSLFIKDRNGNKQVLTHDSKGNPFSRFYGISEDSHGNYWLCDKDNGVYKMTPNGAGGYTIINFQHHDDDKWSLSSNNAYQTVEDQQGNIWVATYGGGVNILKKQKDGSYLVYNRHNKMKRYPNTSHLRVRTIAMDKDGKIWAGTTDGILIMSLENDNFVYEKLESPKDMSLGLTSNDIMCLARDAQNNMWVGTNSGGLSCTTSKDETGTWQFVNYGLSNGLPSEEIRSITFDDKGNVWFSTDHMICSFDVNKNIVTTFSSLDGVDDTLCSEGAAEALPNGIILFGTLNGYYRVDRSKLITKTGSLLKLRITDFFLNDELQSPRLGSKISYYVPESKRVLLPKHNGVFTFRFTSLNYQFQHRIHYQYKLEGHDVDWRNADASRTASYSDVPAGTYKFKVKAFLLESPEHYDMRTIEVVIPPYFMLSTTAVWCYLIVIALLALGGLSWHQRRLARKYGVTTNNEESLETTEDGDQEEEITDDYEIIED